MFRLTIRSKMTLLLLGFGLLPVLAILPIITSELGKMKQSVLTDRQSMAGEVSELIDRNFFERYGDVQAFGYNSAAQNLANWYRPGEGNPLTRAMNQYMRNYGFYKLMLLVDLKGNVAAVNSVDAKGAALDTHAVYAQNFVDAPWFVKAKNREFLKGEGVDGTVVEQPAYVRAVADTYRDDGYSIAFAAPVYDARGQMLGVWVNFADYGLVEGIAASVYSSKKTAGEASAAIAITDSKGTLLLDYDPAHQGNDSLQRNIAVIGKKSIEHSGIPAAVRILQSARGEEVSRDENSNKEDVVVWQKTDGAEGFPGMGWTVIVHQPAEDVFEDIFATEHLLELVLLVSLVVVGLAGLVVGIKASRPILRLTEEIKRLSEGDYSSELHGEERRDEIGTMVAALNQNVRKIRATVAAIKQAASSVNTAASEIAAGSADLSVRTEEQASSLEETAASMEEITTTVRQNSQSAGNANALAAKAAGVAADGSKVVENAVLAMGAIEKSSQRIADIIGVMDDIAFQTNLLALNAAVEAARAGDAGKGFAVVASEVRSLAGRSSLAAKEIRGLINEGVAQVKEGTLLVNKAGESLNGIVASAQQVAGIVSDIAAASVQQTAGIDEVNAAVTQMDEVTQQNAALVEENTAAAQSMLEQARGLEQLVRFFKVQAETVVAQEPEVARAAASSPSPRRVAVPTPHNVMLHRSKTVRQVAVGSKAYDENWEEF